MHENRFFILSSDLTGLEPVVVDGRPATFRYAELARSVEAICGRDAAALFAEPVLPRGVETRTAAISWYASREGQPLELASIDEIARQPTAGRLAERLNALAPALSDPDAAPLLAAALCLPSNRDIVSVSGEPLLVNWGHLPAEILADPARRQAHFAQTLGTFAPGLIPLFAATQQAPGAAVSPSAPIGTPQAPPPISKPTESQIIPAWRASMIATLIAGLLLLILLLPGVLAYPERNGNAARDAFEAERLKVSNDLLQAQLDALQKAAREKVCRADGTTSVDVPGFSPSEAGKQETAPRMELTPRAPEQAALPRRPTGEPQQAGNVGELLEKATVLVIAPIEKKGVSTGSGFFISDRYVVTNHHVIQGANPQIVFVASKALNGVRRARVIAKTEPGPSEKEARPDFAVLELDPVSGVGALRLTTTPPKLSTAYVAGFPGFLVQRDANFAKLFKELGETLHQADPDQALANRQISVPGADLRYGRINNVMTVGGSDLSVIIHDMQLAQGNSGGPVVDGCGRLDGVNTMLFPNKEAGYQQGNVAQDVAVLRKFLTEKQIAFTAEDTPCASGQDAPPPPSASGAK